MICPLSSLLAAVAARRARPACCSPGHRRLRAGAV